jgi:uncharacterized protein
MVRGHRHITIILRITMSLRIFANHAHLFPASVNPEGSAHRLLRLMDACGIEQAVCFAPFPHQLEGSGVAPNAWLADQLALDARLHGFGTLDLRRTDVKDQVARLRDLGLRGIKMHPNAQQFDILCPAAIQAYAAAEELKLFITFHSGIHHYRLTDYNVLKFDEVAWHFPDLRFSLEHIGGWAFFREAVAVISNNIPFPPVPGQRCRVYGGLTSVFTADYNRLWYLPRSQLIQLIGQVGPEQLIFGLDFPYNLEQNTHTALRTIADLGLDNRQQQMILGDNLREALGLRG